MQTFFENKKIKSCLLHDFFMIFQRNKNAMSFDIADDIDAAFDSIVLVEDNLVQSGFQEGYLQVINSQVNVGDDLMGQTYLRRIKQQIYVCMK